MKVLSIDTSSRWGVVGLGVDGEIIAEASIRSHEVHSARLLPSIDWVLQVAGIHLNEIDAFGVVIGPGSFTGLRVGLATIKGLAWAKAKPVVALNSLEVLAGALEHHEGLIAPMLDARKGRVYGAIYQWHLGKLTTHRKPEDVDVQKMLLEHNETILCFGDGVRRYESVLRNFKETNIQIANPTYDIPRGAVLVRMAELAVKNQKAVDISTLEPVYLRLSEAEMSERMGTT